MATSKAAESTPSESKYSLVKEDDLPRSITSKRLDGLNYLSWAHAVKVFLRGKRKLQYITSLPPSPTDPLSDDWLAEDSVVMGWLWHSLEPHIATTVEFCDSSKKIWDSLAESFSQQSNVSRFFELYEQIFTTKQSGQPLSAYYSTLKNLWEQLLQHRPFTSDLEQQKRHWEDFMIASLLSGLDPSLRGFKDQISYVLVRGSLSFHLLLLLFLFPCLIPPRLCLLCLILICRFISAPRFAQLFLMA